MVKKGYFCILLCISAIVGICGCSNNTASYVNSEEHTESELSTEAGNVDGRGEITESKATENPKEIYVYVCGAVTVPGVYAIEDGSRVYDLFQLAGGLTENAAEDYWNQARLLMDGEMIYVPTLEEAQERTSEEWDAAGSITGTKDTSKQENGKININTASMEELMMIPGIGESKAMAIISYREENGGFSSIEELKEIPGIKDGVFSKIQDYILVN